jgi:hypothetical protein
MKMVKIMKYKICKIQDGNAYEWYQVKIKGLIFWRLVTREERFGIRGVNL